MNVVIVKKAPERTRRLILSKFPHDWKVVVVTPEELNKELEDVEAIIPEHHTIDGPLLDRAKNLKLVQTGAGYDNVMVDECTKRGVYVANAAGVNASAVAEHVFAFILCWYKNMIPLDGLMKRGENGIDCIGAELSGKAIGIVGLGNIGREVARLAKAFNMNVLGYHVRPIDTEVEIELKDFETLLRSSDVVTLHTPLNDRTKHLIGRRELVLMREDAFLINTSRGQVVNEAALIEALQSKKIGGAGLDVFETEPLPKNSPLRKLNNVILTPHRAGSPDGLHFHHKRYEFFLENIRRVSEGRAPIKALNRIEKSPRSGFQH
ncbi:MAG: phosphoglycerate dehydrogenase [Gammaproteobacteria bacterium]|nr:phosphoglycerate dehydrogenase [Gammaproteobacteria bacterium]